MSRNETERTDVDDVQGLVTQQLELLESLLHPADRPHPLVSIHPNEITSTTAHDTGAESTLADQGEHELMELQRVAQERRDQRKLERNRLLALKRLRSLTGLSRRGAARSIGVSTSVVRAWENQQRVPSADELDSIIDLYGAGLDDLLGPRQPLESADHPGVLVIGDVIVDTNEIRARIVDVAECNRTIVSTYLQAVRHVRGDDDVEQPALRSKDLIDLARVLDVSDHDLDRLFAEEFGLPTRAAQRASRALMVAGLMNTTVVTRNSVGWTGGTTSADPVYVMNGRPTESSVFATVSAPPSNTALRKPIFASTTGPVPVDTPDPTDTSSDLDDPPFRRTAFNT